MYAGTCSGNVWLMILQYIPGSSGWLMVSWCYWVSHKPCFFLFQTFFFREEGEGLVLLEVLALSGWGGEGREEVEDGLMLAPRPPGWPSGAPGVGTWTSAWSLHSTWGTRKGSGRPSATGVVGWLDQPVGGSRSPGEERLASEAGPANDREVSEWEEAAEASAARLAVSREARIIKEWEANEKQNELIKGGLAWEMWGWDSLVLWETNKKATDAKCRRKDRSRGRAADELSMATALVVGLRPVPEAFLPGGSSIWGCLSFLYYPVNSKDSPLLSQHFQNILYSRQMKLFDP